MERGERGSGAPATLLEGMLTCLPGSAPRAWEWERRE